MYSELSAPVYLLILQSIHHLKGSGAKLPYLGPSDLSRSKSGHPQKDSCATKPWALELAAVLLINF